MASSAVSTQRGERRYHGFYPYQVSTLVPAALQPRSLSAINLNKLQIPFPQTKTEGRTRGGEWREELTSSRITPGLPLTTTSSPGGRLSPICRAAVDTLAMQIHADRLAISSDDWSIFNLNKTVLHLSQLMFSFIQMY